MKRIYFMFIAILIFMALGATALYFLRGEDSLSYCAQDAKLCPDGTYVGRTGPNCEFAACSANVVGGDKDSHGCVGSAGYSWCEATQKCLRIWEESCYPADEAVIKNLFSKKYGKPLSEISVTVSKDDGGFMVGGALFGERGVGEGGNFLAAKIGGEWKIIFDGNGGISCKELAPYNFPSQMIKDLCY